MNITTPDSYLNDTSIRKRRPGRPKGSGTKVKERILPKRPVGRPRRDGLPSGSVNFRPKRVIVEFEDENDGDWAKLLHTEPDTFLSTLVITLSALPPPASSGPSAEEAFKSHLKSLAPTSSQNQNLPSLYSLLKTFWIPTSPAYFSLTASASTRTLSDHRFFYWDPQPLVINGISCPSCSAPLANEGRIKHGPLKIYDVERPFFVIGAEYVCKSEGKTYASTDPSILHALPQKLRDELPVKLDNADKDVGSDEKAWCWKPAGVSKTLWNLVLGCVQAGLKKDVTVKLIRSTQKGVEIPSGEHAKAADPDQGFTDNAWTANNSTADEENSFRQQEPEGSQTPSPSSTPPPSYGPFATSSGQAQPASSFGSTPFQYIDYDSPRAAPTLATIGNMTRTLHNGVSPIASTQSQSSLNGAMGGSDTLGHSLTGPGSSPPLQLLTPSTIASRLTPISSAATPILTPAVAAIPTSSSSSIAQGSSNSPPFSQVPQAPHPTQVYDYAMGEYPEQQPSPQRPQITQNQASHLHPQSQPQPQIQVHNPYHQNQGRLALAQLNFRPTRETSNGPSPLLMSMPMTNSPHDPRRTDNTSTLNGNISSPSIIPAVTNSSSSSAQHPTPGFSILQHIDNTSNTLPRAAAPILAPALASAPAPTSAPVPVPLVSPAAANGVSTTVTSPARSTSFVSSQRQRTRNPRHCSKCGSTSCKGKGGRTYCTSTCKDCGRFECRGRNSRRPDKNCVEGWV